MKPQFLALIIGGIGPDVWDKELDIWAVDITDALTQANATAEEMGGVVYSVEQNHRPSLRSDGVKRIAAERERQITQEGWTARDDDGHSEGELARAAAVYADASVCLAAGRHPQDLKEEILNEGCETPWPWEDQWLKLTTPIRALEKAGALIAAEIDRLQRLEAYCPPSAED